MTIKTVKLSVFILREEIYISRQRAASVCVKANVFIRTESLQHDPSSVQPPFSLYAVSSAAAQCSFGNSNTIDKKKIY